MSKTSPVRQNPVMPARNVSISAWKYVPIRVKYRQENTSDPVISTAPRQASPALSGPASKSIPMTTPRTGRKPANQYVESPPLVW